MKKNLVMGAATHYDWNALEPFVTSFKRNCPSAELVLFVDDISNFTRNRLLGAGVLLVDIPTAYRNGLIVNFRFKIYNDFLEAYGNKYEQVLITDTRDVIFQGDVFAPFKNYSSYLGYTTERQLIGDDKVYNYRWIESCFGKAEAEKLADKKAICAGTVIGTVNEMKLFCHKMWEIVNKTPNNNFDQGTMNYLVYNNLLPIENLIEIDTFTGEIFTNGVIKENKIRDDKILRGDGGVPAVVHQYDRHGDLVQLADNIYRDRNFQAADFADVRSNLEQVKQLLFFGKLNEAARLYMKNFLDGANFDTNTELLLKLWEMLLNLPLTPAVGYLELSTQSALASVKVFSVRHVNTICLLLKHSIKNQRSVDFRFVNFIANALLNLSEQSLNNGDSAQCFYCFELIKSLDLPPQKDFYLMQAKAYRTFGKKEEALAAYKKVLELS